MRRRPSCHARWLKDFGLRDYEEGRTVSAPVIATAWKYTSAGRVGQTFTSRSSLVLSTSYDGVACWDLRIFTQSQRVFSIPINDKRADGILWHWGQ